MSGRLSAGTRLADAARFARQQVAGETAGTFSRSDLVGVVEAMNVRKSFYAFVVERFLEVAATGFTFETTTGVKVTVNDQPEDVWNDWRVPVSFEDGYASVLVQDDYIPIQRILVGARGEVERVGATIMFDLDVLFGEPVCSERG